MSIISFTSATHQISNLTTFYPYDPYIERFWQPILGPTATGLLNLLTLEAMVSDEFNTSLNELSRRTGTGLRQGNSSPAVKQLKRLTSFGLIETLGENQYQVFSTIRSLNNSDANLLTHKEKLHHQIWCDRLIQDPLKTQLHKASHLVLVMKMMGYENAQIGSAIYNSGLHPCIIGQLTKTSPFADVT